MPVGADCMRLFEGIFQRISGLRFPKPASVQVSPPNCQRCGGRLDVTTMECRICGGQHDVPNVRQALLEISELQSRLDREKHRARRAGTSAELDALEHAVANSKAVVSRPFEEFAALAMDGNRHFISFSAQVRAGARTPSDNDLDRARVQWENALFPNYSEKVIFGSLSLAERGMRNYGDVDIILREDAIQGRSSVFHENGLVFSKKHSLRLHDVLPKGYRATWADRGKLAAAKLGIQIKKGMSLQEFDQLLQNDRGGGDRDDFVEFHMYGSFNRDVIEKAVATPEPAEKDYWESIRNRLQRNGSSVATETR